MLAPAPLVELLQRLGLARAAQVEAVAGRARRLARGLPLFESVWIDALAQSRLLTPYQAAELNAGRGELLRVGPYLLAEPLAWPFYGQGYRARHAESGELVRLIVAETDVAQRPTRLRRLEELTASSTGVGPLVPRAAGVDGARLWAAAPWTAGRTAASWMVEHGRFPPLVVAAIARQMASHLAALEAAGLHHGDLSAHGLLLTARGEALPLLAGLRPILRPEEGYSFADLPPEAFATLAPERVSEGAPSSVGTDLYACGCLWWQLLCGREALAGGSSLARLQAAHAAVVPDVCELAPEAPRELVEVVRVCLEPDPARRPDSMKELVARLGASSPGDCGIVARCLNSGGANFPRPRRRVAARSASRGSTGMMLAGGGLAVVLALALLLGEPGPPAAPAPTRTPEVAGPVSPEPRKPSVRPRSESSPRVPVALAAAENSSRLKAAATTDPLDPPVVDLPGGRPLAIEAIRLEPGQTVRGTGREPTVLIVPPDGLAVTSADACFENLRFVAPTARTAAEPSPLVRLQASGARFERCVFEGADDAPAIAWTASGSAARQELPSGRLQLHGCVFRQIDAALDIDLAGALAVELENVLHRGHGPLVRLGHAPRLESPVVLLLGKVTLRESGPLVECPAMSAGGGELSVRATACALAPRPGVPLVLFTGPSDPTAGLGNLVWTGQGSLLGPDTPMAAWQRDGRSTPLDDAGLSIAGLARSRMDFAGPAADAPQADQVVGWQAPLLSPDPPGAETATLPGSSHRMP